MKTFFVSSTFRDMDEERDAIQQITLPRLNAAARTYGEAVSFCDLRWGIDTNTLESDEGSKKVLDVCLDEIDRCRPPMIVILGYRYGWLPPKELIGEAARRRQLSLDNLQKSITALEIEYGALPENACANTLFYFREFDGDVPDYCAAEDAQHFTLLQDLKQRIRHLSGNRVKTYHVRWDGQSLEGVTDFARLLADDLEALMRPEWERCRQLSPRERELRIHRDYLQSKAAMFYARNAFAEELAARIHDGETRLVLQDISGSGKSTFFAHLALRLEQEGFTVFPLFCGLTTETSTASDILQKIVYFLEETLGLSHPLEHPDSDTVISEKKWQLRLNELCRLCGETDRRIVIMVDAMDQLLQDSLRDSLLFLPQDLSTSLRLIVTCLDPFPLKNLSSCSFPALEQAEKEDMIRAILNAHHRELSPPVVTAMSRLPQSGNPLYASLLIQRMLMMDRQDFERIRQLGDGISAIIAHQLEILDSCPRELDQLCVTLLEIAGERIHPGLVSRISQLLAVSRRGLRTEDLQGLLGADFNTLDFVHFITYMSDSFILRNDGRYDFSHRNIRNGYLAACPEPAILHRQLIRHFLSLPEDDPIRKTELVYHMAECDDRSGLIAYLERYEDHDDSSIIRAAAATLFEVCLSRPSWLSALIRNADAYGAGRNFIRFLVWEFRARSTGSRQEDALAALAMKETADLAERLQIQGIDIQREYAKAIYFLTGSLPATPDGRRAAVLSYLLCFDQFHALRLQNNTPLAQIDEARACKALASAYSRISSERKALHYIGRAISLAKEAAAAKETRTTLLFLSDCYAKQAEIARSDLQDPSVHKKVLACQEQSLDYMRQAAQAYPQADSRRAHCIAYQQSGSTLTQIGGSEHRANLQKALDYYEKALALALALEKENRDWDSCQQQANCHQAIADILIALGRKKNKDAILQHRLAALNLQNRLFSALHTEHSRKAAASLFAEIAEHRLLCDASASTAVKAIREYENAIAFYRNSTEKINDIEELLQPSQIGLARTLAPVYYSLSTALQRADQKDEARAAYQTARRLHRFCLSDAQSYAYAELIEVLCNMDSSYIQMIPYSIQQIFRDYRDRQYQKHLNPGLPLEAQKLSPKTAALIAFLSTNYWSASPDERKDLISVFNENEEKYQRELEALSMEELMEEAKHCQKADPQRAFYCYRHAASKGSEEAQFKIADCYWNGTGTQTDFEKALETLVHLAQEGSPKTAVKAASQLGQQLTAHRFYKQGIPWLLQAAGQGNGPACARLIEMYETGQGVSPDAGQAAYWREKAEEFRLARRNAFLERSRQRRLQKAASQNPDQPL